jgi:drug/metabolite transporter (DMT)-like permease
MKELGGVFSTPPVAPADDTVRSPPMKKAAGPLALGPPFGAGSVLSSAHTKNACLGLALVLYLANNTLLNLYSKYVFDELGFDFPVLIILFHQAAVYFVLRSLTVGCVIERPDYETVTSLAWPCLAVGIVFGVNIMCNSASLVTISLSLNQCIKALVPAIGLIFYFLHTHRSFPPGIYAAAAATAVGVTMVVVRNPSFHTEGVALAFASAVTAASQNCVASLVLRSKPKAIIHMTMYVVGVVGRDPERGGLRRIGVVK